MTINNLTVKQRVFQKGFVRLSNSMLKTYTYLIRKFEFQVVYLM